MNLKAETIWSILAVLSVFAYALGHFKLISTFLVAILLISTFLKGQLISDYFMGLKETRLRYRLIPTLWLILILSMIAVAYYLPSLKTL
ncbi:MAG: cytochrome C oxidase subunit IV family protein [Sulfuricurvum sp.]|uniref:cytochrome C oxidase subunit IV family protein n=1 Tax=Sulfuricurvum sp. TaxID=2025608 RepID=UPI0025F6CE4D|nr:cytochrome C oxidase subunit IV family protein [Sulfuricurvum sp.]MBV5322154.1 cytochrome C oxidase subunit IV family protein [Sulfuricurvum sp.]